MSENVGLSTPRGSGTSGYVQRSLAHIRPRDRATPYKADDDSSFRHRPRQPDQGILEHERKREVELKVLELRDQLEDEEVSDGEIEERCDDLRKQLLAKQKAGKNVGGPAKAFKQHQVHQMADAKIKESERLRKALGIKANYEEGDHWKRQQEKKEEPKKEELRSEEPKKQEKRVERDERPRDAAPREEGEVDSDSDDEPRERQSRDD